VSSREARIESMPRPSGRFFKILIDTRRNPDPVSLTVAGFSGQFSDRRQLRATRKRTARLSDDPLPGRHIVTSASVIGIHEDAGTCSECCYVGVAGGRGKGLEESLRGSVGNSGGRRVVNFRLHRRAPSRLRPTSPPSSWCCLLLRLAPATPPLFLLFFPLAICPLPPHVSISRRSILLFSRSRV